MIGVDWRMRLDDAWRHDRPRSGHAGQSRSGRAVGRPAEVRRRVREMLAKPRGRPGHIFNLGHGVLPQTPVENVLAMIEAVHEGRREGV